MNIYQHYNFTWKWINQAYDISDARADEFGGEYERIVNTGTVCVEGVMVKYETEWGVKRANLTGDCVNAPWVPVTTSVVPVVTQALNSADPPRALTQSSADLTLALTQFFSPALEIRRRCLAHHGNPRKTGLPVPGDGKGQRHCKFQ